MAARIPTDCERFHRRYFLQVGAAGEGPPGAGDEDRPDLGVLGNLRDRVAQVGGELPAPRVHPLGPVQLDLRPRTATVQVDRLILAV